MMMPLNTRRAQLLPVSEKRVDKVRLLMASALMHDQEVAVSTHPAGTVRDFSSGEEVARAVAKVAALSDGWVDFDMSCSVEPGLYWMEVQAAKGLSWAMSRNWELGVDGRPLPYLDRVVSRWIDNETVASTELRAGTVDYAEFQGRAPLEPLQNDPRFRVSDERGMSEVNSLAINMIKVLSKRMSISGKPPSTASTAMPWPRC